jgi:hypothetical protein
MIVVGEKIGACSAATIQPCTTGVTCGSTIGITRIAIHTDSTHTEWVGGTELLEAVCPAMAAIQNIRVGIRACTKTTVGSCPGRNRAIVVW